MKVIKQTNNNKKRVTRNKLTELVALRKCVTLFTTQTDTGYICRRQRRKPQIH